MTDHPETALEPAPALPTSSCQVHAARVREDFLRGVRSGVNGTATFFVNGVRHNGGYDLESLLAAIRSSL